MGADFEITEAMIKAGHEALWSFDVVEIGCDVSGEEVVVAIFKAMTRAKEQASATTVAASDNRR